MLILENSTKTGLKHRVIRKVQSEFCPKELFYKRTKRRQLNSLTKKPYNLKNANSKMSRNARFEGYHIFFINRDNKFFTTVLTFKNLTGVLIVFVF